MDNINVLFVDDEEKILSSIRRGIIGEKFKGLFANSAKKALEIMEQNEVAVIVTDMRMPEMDGLELLEEVKEKYPDTIRMVLSGYSQLVQVIATINKVGVFKFILKPWNLEDDFLVSIREAIGYYNLKKEGDRLKEALEKKNELYQNLLMSSDKMLMEMKKGFSGFANVNEYVLGNLKKFISSKGSNISSDLGIKYVEMAEDFYKKYSEIVFEVNTSFTFEKLSSEIKEYIESKEHKVKFGIENNLDVVVKGRYKLVKLLISNFVDKILDIYKEELTMVLKIQEKEKKDGQILSDINIIIQSPSDKDFRELLIMSMFFDKLIKDFDGECSIKQDMKFINIIIRQWFKEAV